MNGYGRCIYNNNTYYYGDFLDDKRHGFGIFYDDDVKFRLGTWENDILVDQTILE